MNAPTDQTAELDYLLGVGSAPAPTTTAAELVPPVASVPPVQLSTTVPSVGATAADVAALAVPSPVPEPATATASSPGSAPVGSPDSAGGSADTGLGNSKKRPLEDKKARDRKRVLRNRELARVSNERRKGRIKAMEGELTETRQTVSTLEESIRCLEAENKELRNLLQGKPDGSAPGAPPVAQPPIAPQ